MNGSDIARLAAEIANIFAGDDIADLPEKENKIATTLAAWNRRAEPAITNATNADIAREINELLGVGEHVSDCGAGPDPLIALLDKYYPPVEEQP